jgi:divalent metal cation (Fe/Co/Zn/Cd) transporter
LQKILYARRQKTKKFFFWRRKIAKKFLKENYTTINLSQLVSKLQNSHFSEISRILAISLDHDERIKCLDHVMVYHIGELALVELHIVLDERLPLRVTHDICEQLQDKINSLEFVERSFIHVRFLVLLGLG